MPSSARARKLFARRVILVIVNDLDQPFNDALKQALGTIDLEPPAVGEECAPYQPCRPDAIARRLTSAGTDSALAREYLYGSGLSAATIDNYKKEIYRFLRYCQANGLTIGELKISHMNAFSGFLRNPQPADDWVSETRHSRMTVDPSTGKSRPNPLWRPFSGPLSASSSRQALSVVKAFMHYAEKTGYIVRNPAALVKQPRQERHGMIERYLPLHAIELAFAAVEDLPTTRPFEVRRRARDAFLLTAWWNTGCRLAEIVSATMGSVYCETDGRWWLDVVGKGAKKRRVPLPPEFLHSLRAYRTAFDLAPDAYRGDNTPLVLSTRRHGLQAVTDEAAANGIKAIFALAAQKADALGDASAAAQLRHATTHWLRHSMLSHHANGDVHLKTLQLTAGHSTIAMTGRYLHREDNERHDELMASFARRRGTTSA